MSDCGATATPCAAVALTHGAGSNREAPLLVALDAAFTARGCAVLRYDLPFRRARASGPPRPAERAADLAGVREGAVVARAAARGTPVVLAGHSYGGRLASHVLAEEPAAADALLLLSYPLHPPRRPTELRVAHWPRLRTPTFFVHGDRDPFGSVEALRREAAALAAPWELLTMDGAGHDLLARRRVRASGSAAAASEATDAEGPTVAVAHRIADAFLAFVARAASGRG